MDGFEKFHDGQQELLQFTAHPCTGVGSIMVPRFREYEVKKFRSCACSRQEYAIFYPHIHKTWEPYFSPSL